MEILVWLFLGLMAFIAWLVFITYRIDERNRTERRYQLERRREVERHHDRAFWAQAEEEAVRLRERASQAGKPFVGPGGAGE